MEKENMGFKASVKDGKLTIEIEVDNLVSGFNGSPNNYEECVIKEDKKQQFAEYVAELLIELSDSETGNSLIMDALDRTFEEAIENGKDFIDFNED